MAIRVGSWLYSLVQIIYMEDPFHKSGPKSTTIDPDPVYPTRHLLQITETVILLFAHTRNYNTNIINK